MKCNVSCCEEVALWWKLSERKRALVAPVCPTYIHTCSPTWVRTCSKYGATPVLTEHTSLKGCRLLRPCLKRVTIRVSLAFLVASSIIDPAHVEFSTVDPFVKESKL